jgi:hypothetical protein
MANPDYTPLRKRNPVLRSKPKLQTLLRQVPRPSRIATHIELLASIGTIRRPLDRSGRARR